LIEAPVVKKLRILISVQYAVMLAYRAEIYLWVLAYVLPFIMMSVWMKAASSGANVAMTPVEYARYFVAAFIVRQFSAVWMIYDFEWYVVEGRLSPMLLRPMNVLWHYVAAHIGEQMARLPFFLIMLALFFVLYPAAFWLCPGPPGHIAAALGLGIAAIYAAFALRFSTQYCFCTAAFWVERASALDQLSWMPYMFLSGMVIPLADMPPTVRELLYYTPFPYCVDFPVRILMGTLRWDDPTLWQGFGVMAAWFAGQALLGAVLWKLGLRRYSGHGA
jgi:ABC-2 type transport system permease protein